MTENHSTLAPFYKGWDAYQDFLIQAIAPLTNQQFDLRAAPSLRSIGEITAHIIAVRARWFHSLMGEGGAELDSIMEWDRPGAPALAAAEYVSGFETTLRMIQDALARWTPADLEYVFEGTHQGEEYKLSRQWVIWHVIVHDLHHGGEISLTLGMHGLTAPDL